MRNALLAIFFTFLIGILLGIVFAGFVSLGFLRTEASPEIVAAYSLINKVYVLYSVAIFIVIIVYLKLLHVKPYHGLVKHLKASIKTNTTAIELILLSQVLFAIKASELVSPGLKIIPGLIAFVLFLLLLFIFVHNKNDCIKILFINCSFMKRLWLFR